MLASKSSLRLLIVMLTAGLMLSACRLDRDTLRGGQLYVASTPADATLVCDGVNMGQTPTNIMDVGAGEHLLILRKSGYREVRKTVKTQPSERQAVDLKLEPLTGLLLILSTPSGADIDLNGVSAGKTPLYLHDAAFDQHRLTASAPGHLPRVITLTVADQVPQKIEIKPDIGFRPDPGRDRANRRGDYARRGHHRQNTAKPVSDCQRGTHDQTYLAGVFPVPKRV